MYHGSPIPDHFSGGDEPTTREPPSPPKSPRKPLPDIESAGVTTAGTSTSTSTTNRVNGKGMWRAWTRSFDTPMLALLDLFDNAVDASWTLLGKPTSTTTGQSNTNSKRNKATPTKPRIHALIDPLGQQGIVLRNACSDPIPPLNLVLEVYRSSKQNDLDIGENGIGVKHACASLCPLSFVFTKSATEYGIGLLMEELQQEEGIVLPSCQIGIYDDVEEKLTDLASELPNVWGRAFEVYGKGSVDTGIQHCVRHLKDLSFGDYWDNQENVFSLLLTHLRHATVRRREEVTEDALPSVEQPSTGADSSRSRSEAFLDELAEQLPSFYLHLDALEVVVQQQRINPYYWETRLVELTKFEVDINHTVLWSQQGNDLSAAAEPPHSDNAIRFFAGFDPHHCKENTDDDVSLHPGSQEIPLNSSSQSCLKVYMYSRQSGRLIKIQTDPRSELGVNASSNNFKQGMRIIVDDYHGTLPLNPTKQDTAFGHSTHGLIHAANIREWTAAIVHFYWTYHVERLGNSKQGLGEGVSEAKTELQRLFESNNSVKPIPLRRGGYIVFDNLRFHVGTKSARSVNIRVTKRGRADAVGVPYADPSADDDSNYDPVRVNERAAAKVVTRAMTSTPKRNARQSPAASQFASPQKETEGNALVDTDDEEYSTPSRKRKASKSVASPGHNDEGDDQENVRSSRRRVSRVPQSHLVDLQDSEEDDQDMLVPYNGRTQKRAKPAPATTLPTETEEYKKLEEEYGLLKIAKAKVDREVSKAKKSEQRANAEATRLRLELIERKKDFMESRKTIQDLQEEINTLKEGQRQSRETPDVSRSNGTGRARNGCDNRTVDNLELSVQLYKSRATFYEKQLASMKKRLDDVNEEKAQCEARINELEEATLSVLTER